MPTLGWVEGCVGRDADRVEGCAPVICTASREGWLEGSVFVVGSGSTAHPVTNRAMSSFFILPSEKLRSVTELHPKPLREAFVGGLVAHHNAF